MLYAATWGTDERILAKPGEEAFCPQCGDLLIPKCGKVNIWHWAHSSLNECDSWNEGETEWHLGWKQLADPSRVEVVIDEHRADLVSPHKDIVIEFQNSSISVDDILKREAHYGDMMWVLNGYQFAQNFHLRKLKDAYGRYAESIYTFRWKYPRRVWWESEKPIVIDFSRCDIDGVTGDKVFRIEKMSADTPCGGWGYLVDIDSFIRKYINPHYSAYKATA